MSSSRNRTSSQSSLAASNPASMLWIFWLHVSEDPATTIRGGGRSEGSIWPRFANSSARISARPRTPRDSNTSLASAALMTSRASWCAGSRSDSTANTNSRRPRYALSSCASQFARVPGVTPLTGITTVTGGARGSTASRSGGRAASAQ